MKGGDRRNGENEKGGNSHEEAASSMMGIKHVVIWGKGSKGVGACVQTDAVKSNLKEKWFSMIKKKNDISYQKTKPINTREKTM